MSYRTEGTTRDAVHETGAYATLEEALIGLHQTLNSYTLGTIKEEGDGPTLIHMWREPNSPVCYTRIHFERIQLLLEKRREAVSQNPPPLAF